MTIPLPVVIALGANLPSEQGSPQETLEAALALLAARGVTVSACSRWYTAPAWPSGSGPDYVNGAALLHIRASAGALLDMLHRTEVMLGRQRGPDRWSARPVDLDLLCRGAMVAPGIAAWRRMAEAPPETPRSEPVLPHPRLHRRAFVLKPMADVAPDWRHPVLNRTVREMLGALPAAEREAVAPLD